MENDPCIRIRSSLCVSVCDTLVRKISTEPLNCMQPNLVWVVHHHDPECHAKRLGSCLQGQGHSLGSDTLKIITVSSISPELLNLFVTEFGIVVHHHTLECCVAILDCCPCRCNNFGHNSVSFTTDRKKIKLKKEGEKVGFSLFRNKVHHSEIRIQI